MKADTFPIGRTKENLRGGSRLISMTSGISLTTLKGVPALSHKTRRLWGVREGTEMVTGPGILAQVHQADAHGHMQGLVARMMIDALGEYCDGRGMSPLLLFHNTQSQKGSLVGAVVQGFAI